MWRLTSGGASAALWGKRAKTGAMEGERRLDIDEFEFVTPGLEGIYTEFPRPAGMAIRRGLSRSSHRAREVEAHGHFLRPPVTGRKLCFRNRVLEELDYGSVRAIRRTVDEMEPAWVDAVKRAAWMGFNRADLIAGWLWDEWALDLQVVEAILLNLKERGELPDE